MDGQFRQDSLEQVFVNEDFERKNLWPLFVAINLMRGEAYSGSPDHINSRNEVTD